MRIDPPAAASATARLPLVDALRGLALVAMAVYHFSWDLHFFGYLAADVGRDLGWRIFARLIAGSFLALVGVSLVLATRQRFRVTRFLRRLALVGVSAAGITVVTWLVFPDSFIFFGILHAITVSSVLGLAFVRAPLALVAAAAAFCVLAPRFLAGPLFDAPALLWLGLAEQVPRSNDFVPLLPWFAAVLGGILAARLLPSAEGWRARIAAWGPRPLVWAGRHSLVIYLVHQPILLGLVYLAVQVAPPGRAALEAGFLRSCAASCTEAGAAAELCGRTCTCLAAASRTEGLWDGVLRDQLGEAETLRYYELAEQCRRTASPP